MYDDYILGFPLEEPRESTMKYHEFCKGYLDFSLQDF